MVSYIDLSDLWFTRYCYFLYTCKNNKAIIAAFLLASNCCERKQPNACTKWFRHYTVMSSYSWAINATLLRVQYHKLTSIGIVYDVH